MGCHASPSANGAGNRSGGNLLAWFCIRTAACKSAARALVGVLHRVFEELLLRQRSGEGLLWAEDMEPLEKVGRCWWCWDERGMCRVGGVPVRYL